MKSPVRPKKHLGQHFLKDANIARRIAGLLTRHESYNELIEIGPGTGLLSTHLLDGPWKLYLLEVDAESITYLQKHFSQHLNTFILHQDFLKYDLSSNHSKPVGIIGNFPYNISSQIFFHILEHRMMVSEVVCMLQKEVAERLASAPGSKDYGILSVLLQAFYQIEYVFTVPPHVFEPPPKVHSAVIRLLRKHREPQACSYSFFVTVVKTAFNQRRKMLRNTLAPFIQDKNLLIQPIFEKRPEQLSFQEFETLAKIIEQQRAVSV